MNIKLLLAVFLMTTGQVFAQFVQKPLPYHYVDLEPHIDAQTMEIHYSKHHAGYVKNLNAAIKGTKAEHESLEAILKNVSKYGDAVRNNAGGHYNHELFWSILSMTATNPSLELSNAIRTQFGNLDSLKNKMNTAASKRFGSGWAWLSIDKNGHLMVSSTPNQDNPLMDIAEQKGTPILGIDVWEHAYYLKYQNRRPDYLSAIWKVINWDEVSRRYALAKSAR